MERKKEMTQIDTSKWGKFRVGDLFETFHGERLKKSDRIEGSTPFVTAGSENQGVADYIVAEKKYSNAITIDMFGNCFYHDGTLFGDDNIYFLISNNISKYSKLFITTIINSTLKEKYSFSHQFRQKDLDTLTINLPSTPDNFPDWQYMEDYMKEITKVAAKRVEKLKEEKPQTKIDTSKWKKFKVGELFDCETTKGIASKNDLVEGNIPYVTRSAENNGKSGYCGNADRIVKGNCITIGAEGFTAFYQENDFVAGNKVYALRHKNLNNVNALYICTVLNKLSCLYSFNNARILDKIKQEVISLPIDNNGEPDWQYMEDYMKEITKLAAKRVEKVKEDKTQTKIDTNTWKKFKVGELFETVNNNGTQVLTGANVPSKELKNGTAPRISATGVNNGVIGYYDSTHKNYKVYNNFISVNFLGNAFYQENNASLNTNVHCLKLKNKELNKYLALFLVTIINKLTTSYSYANQLSSTSITQLQLPLPITSEGTPDFDYIENYMKNIEDCTNNIIEQAKKKI